MWREVFSLLPLGLPGVSFSHSSLFPLHVRFGGLPLQHMIIIVTTRHPLRGGVDLAAAAGVKVHRYEAEDDVILFFVFIGPLSLIDCLVP